MDSFNNKYSTWFLPLTQKQKQQYERLEKLVLSFNVNLKDEVIRAKDKYNLKVRGVIAEKTGVSLTYRTKDIDTKKIDNIDKASIPIKVVDLVPLSLLDLFDKFDDAHIELLLHYRRMKSASKELEFQIRKHPTFSQYHLGLSSVDELNNSIRHLNKLIKEVDDCGILEAIQKLGPDLLGAYFLSDNRVELYWLCIGLCNILHDLPIEDFTLVVLIHELAHGYTHIGFDKDGNYWNTDDFNHCDLKIVEGFAQFYTEMLCRDYFDQATSAFNALLSKQSTEYTEYKNWFGVKEPDKYEKARRILLKTRRSKITKYDEFSHCLEKIKQES
jgi:hypothetical protein